MATTKNGGGLELEMFNDPAFVKRYADGAEKFTGVRFHSPPVLNCHG
jgi:hypothetical protein